MANTMDDKALVALMFGVLKMVEANWDDLGCVEYHAIRDALLRAGATMTATGEIA
jgi:hypothetical protein